MNCEVCNKGPREGLSVFRINPKGQPGIWRCRAHITSEQAEKVDSQVVFLANIIDPPAALRSSNHTGEGRE